MCSTAGPQGLWECFAQFEDKFCGSVLPNLRILSVMRLVSILLGCPLFRSCFGCFWVWGPQMHDLSFSRADLKGGSGKGGIRIWLPAHRLSDPECTTVAAIQLRMRMRILTRPDNLLANFRHCPPRPPPGNRSCMFACSSRCLR